MDIKFQNDILKEIYKNGGILSVGAIASRLLSRPLSSEARHKLLHNLQLLIDEKKIVERPGSKIDATLAGSVGLTSYGYELVEKLERINSIIASLDPEDVKKRIQNFDFSYLKYKSPVVDIPDFKTSTPKSEIYAVIKGIDKEKIEKIKNNFINEISSDQEKWKEILGIPSEELQLYIANTASGTAFVTTFPEVQQTDFLNRGGIIFPDLKSQKTDIQKTSPTVILVEGNHNIVNFKGDSLETKQTKVVSSAETKYQKGEPLIKRIFKWIFLTIISGVLIILIAQYLINKFGW
jgi:hypothetical protein